MNNNMIRSVYIHIPFCKNICSYCDFCKNYYNKDIAFKYLESLEKEIKDNYKSEILDTIYIGGGTPSALSIEQLKKLFKITNIFNLNKNYEFTFECNYDDITEELLVLLRDNKVNRISIGFQTFNDKYSCFLQRKINKEEMFEKIRLAKKYFENINVDLMYGFYGQKLSELKKDINYFLKLDVTHISTYCLIVEKHTKLFIENVEELDDDVLNTMYYKIVNEFKKNGYLHYEISNFSKEGYESKHNLTYWNNNEYYGFGLGASGFVNNVRYDNTRSITKYLKGKYLAYQENVLLEQKIKDEVMLNLRTISGINKKTFENKYNGNIKSYFNLDELVKMKLLIETEENIYIPENKLFISNEIILKLLDTYMT